MSERHAVLVGSLPGADAADAMSRALDATGPHLRHLPDGETGDREQWVVSTIESFRDHPDLRVRREGRWTDYDDQLNLAVRRGHRLDGATIDLGIARAYQASRPAFDRLRDERGLDDLDFQVGVPGPFDLSLFTFGPLGAFRHRRAMAEAVAADVQQVHAAADGDVVFQIEVPAELVFVTKVPAAAQPLMARRMAGMITDVAARAPRGARFGVHLCLGDLGHKALGRMTDARPLVLLANATAARWPADRPLEFVHAPLAAGEEPPPLDRAFYEPLRDLRLPEGTRFVAGLLHEDRSVEELAGVLGAVDGLVGRTVDVAAACGLGRRDAAAAAAVLRQGAELCADHGPSAS